MELEGQQVDFDRFSEAARQVLFYARAAVGELGASSVRSEHLLLGLLRANPESVTRFLGPSDSADTLILDTKGRLVASERSVRPADMIPLSANVTTILRKASQEAESRIDKSVLVEHILLALLDEETGVASEVLRAHGVREMDIRSYLGTLTRKR